MIDEELLISYLQEQKRKYQEQMIILGRELENPSRDINQHEYMLTNIMWDGVANIVQVHTDLIERIKNREFDMQMPQNDLVYPTPEEEYNEDFINEMKRIEKEQSEKLERR